MIEEIQPVEEFLLDPSDPTTLPLQLEVRRGDRGELNTSLTVGDLDPEPAACILLMYAVSAAERASCQGFRSVAELLRSIHAAMAGHTCG